MNGPHTDRTPSEVSPAPDPEFVRLFTRSQRRLYLFILAQVGKPLHAEEILQETNLVIWSKADRFVPGTNFLAWSSQIAAYEVLRFRSRQRREKLQFSQELVERIAAEALASADALEERRAALLHCLKRLRSRDRDLIRRRYAPGETGKNLAETLGRPANSVYQSLSRIRRMLFECVNRQLLAEGHS